MDIQQLKQKFANAFQDQNFLKNLFLGLGILAIILLLSALLFQNVSKTRYAVLYTHLSPDDAGKILSVLQEEKIPYKIAGDGSIIEVPKDKVYDVRLKLAAKGLPSSNDIGFELFNEPKMGTTHFQENINYIRAIEGELARTIKRIDAIKDAKVNIALPQDSIFAREEDEAKASVIVSLWPGKDLTKEQVKAIIFLVSHAVPKLKPQNVTVVDNRGRVLSDLLEEPQKDLKSIVDIKKKIKRDIEKSVQSMLARALGPQKVVVRANVDVETSKVAKQDEIYDPDRVAVVSERKIQEKSKGYDKKSLGTPGTPTNVPATIRSANNNLVLDKSKKDVTTNYDVTKSLIKTEQNIFRIKRLSVGVLIDGKYIKTKDANGSVRMKFVPRSQAEIKAYEELIKSAVGFDPKRGDKVTVISVPFETTQQNLSLAPSQGQDQQKVLLFGAIGGLVLALLGMVGYLYLRNKKLKQQQLEAQRLAALQAEHPGYEEAVSATSALHAKEPEFSLESEPVYQRILHISQEHPELVAELISKWIKEEGK